MSQDNRVMLKCGKCKRITYHTKRNKKSPKQHVKEGKLEFKKYCKFCRVRTEHKETKK